MLRKKLFTITQASVKTIPGRPKFDKSKVCVKCKENRGNVVVRHAVFCKSVPYHPSLSDSDCFFVACRACFFPFVTAKFKRALDPFINEKMDASRRKVLKASGNLLLGFSGGLGSTILLDFINQHYIAPAAVTVNGKPRGGKDHPRNDQVWRNVYVCYVETCAAFLEVSVRYSVDAFPLKSCTECKRQDGGYSQSHRAVRKCRVRTFALRRCF